MTDEGVHPDGRPWVQPLDRAAWRAWLIANHLTSRGVHLVTWHKSTGRPAVGYGEAVEEAKRRGTWTMLDDVEDLVVPHDLAASFDANPPARANWDAFSRSARRGILEWIVQAKRPETRARRVVETATLAARNEKANQWSPREPPASEAS